MSGVWNGRSEVRVGLRVPLKISGKDSNGNAFSLATTSENVSKSGFLCACSAVLVVDSIVDVYLLAAEQEHVGKARVVRPVWPGSQYPLWIKIHLDNRRLGVAVNLKGAG